MYNEIVILAMLRQRPQHGYEIKKGIEQVFGGTLSLNNTVLYPTLKHFEELGAVERQVVPQEGKPNRHIYHLTQRGIELLQTYLRDFPSDLAGNEAEFFTRVAFFDYLEPQERHQIIKKRLTHLQNSLDYLGKMQQLAEEACPTVSARRVLAFHVQQTRNEYQWLVAWLEEIKANHS